MAVPTTQQLIDNVKEAIQKILVGAQSYQIGGRQLTHASLDRLFQLLGDLERRQEREGDQTGGLDLVKFGEVA